MSMLVSVLPTPDQQRNASLTVGDRLSPHQQARISELEHAHATTVTSPPLERSIMTTTTPDLDAIRARLDAATRGPWAPDLDGYTVRAGSWPIAIVGTSLADLSVDYEADEVVIEHTTSSQVADLALITHTPEDIQALLAEIDRLTDALTLIDGTLETHAGEDAAHEIRLILEDTL